MRHWFDTLSDRRVVVEDAFAVGDRVVGYYTYRQMGAIPKQPGATR